MKFVIDPSEGLEILDGNNQYFDGTGSALNSAEIGGGPTVPLVPPALWLSDLSRLIGSITNFPNPNLYSVRPSFFSSSLSLFRESTLFFSLFFAET